MRKTTHTLVFSTNSGRYALDDPQEGRDITCGDVLEIFLNGQWMKGSVEHRPCLYALEHTFEQVVQKVDVEPIAGYYFIGEQGGTCGLCEGMKVRL